MPDRLDLEVAEGRQVDRGGGIGHQLGQLPADRLVAEMGGDGVARDPVEPAGKRATEIPVAVDGPQRVDKNFGRYVFGRCTVT